MKSQLSQMVRMGCPASGVKSTVQEPANYRRPLNLYNLRGLDEVKKLFDTEEWTCSDGKTYRIYPWEDGVWKCVRKEGIQGWRSVTVWYDTDRDVVWWGEKKKYYFNPTCPSDEPGKIYWLCVGSGYATSRVRFTLYADPDAAHDACSHATSWQHADSSFSEGCPATTFIENGESAMASAALSGTTTMKVPYVHFAEEDTTIEPPPGLGPPSGLKVSMAMEFACKSMQAWEASVDRASCDDGETSVGCTDTCSIASYDTASDHHMGESGRKRHGDTGSVGGHSGTASTLSADAHTFVPILCLPDRSAISALPPDLSHCPPALIRTVGQDVGLRGDHQSRTPLTASAPLFKPKPALPGPALPFMPAADVAKAWERQGFVKSRGSNTSSAGSNSSSTRGATSAQAQACKRHIARNWL